MIFVQKKYIGVKSEVCIFPILMAMLFMPYLLWASEITLKSGRVIEGKIIEKTSHHIKVYSSSGMGTYYADDIDMIDGHKFGVAPDSSGVVSENAESPTQAHEKSSKELFQESSRQVNAQKETSANSAPALAPQPANSAPPKPAEEPKNGLIRTTDALGNVTEENYLNGVLNGRKAFYVAGKLAEETMYDQGKRIWMKNYWLPSGELEQESSYFSGENKEGTEKFYSHGHLTMEVKFQNGQQVLQKDYYESGNVKNVHVLKNNVTLSIKSYDEQGVETNETTFDEKGNKIKSGPPENVLDTASSGYQELVDLYTKVHNAYYSGNYQIIRDCAITGYVPPEETQGLVGVMLGGKEHYVPPRFTVLKAILYPGNQTAYLSLEGKLVFDDDFKINGERRTVSQGYAEFVKEKGIWKFKDAHWDAGGVGKYF